MAMPSSTTGHAQTQSAEGIGIAETENATSILIGKRVAWFRLARCASLMAARRAGRHPMDRAPHAPPNAAISEQPGSEDCAGFRRRRLLQGPHSASIFG